MGGAPKVGTEVGQEIGYMLKRLRPTTPALTPTGTETEASSKNRRPHAVKPNSLIWSMGRGNAA